mmetsp:Transcript_13705/g.21954  ORF Transcript_13705/g.21954 Transcript_13705/m.21954 type:complete len:240 (+) Transcript_13705:1881-2600(+)
MRRAPLAERLLLITRGNPIVPWLAPIHRFLRQPFIPLARHFFQRLAHIVLNIRRDAENRTRLQLARQRLQMLRRHETTAVVALLWPRIRVQQKCAAQALIGQHVKHVARITGMHLDVLRTSFTDFAKQHGNAVDVRLTANDAHVGVLHGLMHHVLTAAKPHFKPDILATKQRLKVEVLPLRVLVPADLTGRQRRQVFVQIGLLARPQAFTLEASIEVAPRRTACVSARIFAGVFVVGHA